LTGECLSWIGHAIACQIARATCGRWRLAVGSGCRASNCGAWPVTS